jgi:hypothetical protein
MTNHEAPYVGTCEQCRWDANHRRAHKAAQAAADHRLSQVDYIMALADAMADAKAAHTVAVADYAHDRGDLDFAAVSRLSADYLAAQANLRDAVDAGVNR